MRTYLGEQAGGSEAWRFTDCRAGKGGQSRVAKDAAFAEAMDHLIPETSLKHGEASWHAINCQSSHRPLLGSRFSIDQCSER